MIGRRVRRGRQTAVIIGMYNDIEGGVILDRYIEGFRSWNLDELKEEYNE